MVLYAISVVSGGASFTFLQRKPMVLFALVTQLFMCSKQVWCHADSQILWCLVFVEGVIVEVVCGWEELHLPAKGHCLTFVWITFHGPCRLAGGQVVHMFVQHVWVSLGVDFHVYEQTSAKKSLHGLLIVEGRLLIKTRNSTGSSTVPGAALRACYRNHSVLHRQGLSVCAGGEIMYSKPCMYWTLDDLVLYLA